MAKQVSITKVVHVPSARIFDALTDPARHPLIAWRHFAGHRWRWQLKPVPGFPERNRRGIQATLDRLETALVAE